MRPGENAVRSLLALLVLSALLAGLIAGCGGGDQSGTGGEKKQQAGKAAKREGGGVKAEESNTKIALGTIRAVKEDKRRISLKPTVEAQGDGSLAFRVADNADITLDGKEAELADIAGGQQAQVEFVGGEKGAGRALSVQLFQVQREQPPGEDGQTN